jgi:hypothetical protein
LWPPASSATWSRTCRRKRPLRTPTGLGVVAHIISYINFCIRYVIQIYAIQIVFIHMISNIIFCGWQAIKTWLLCKKLSYFSICLFSFCHVLSGLPRFLGPLGGSRKGLRLKMRFSPAHDLGSTLSNRSHGVPDLAGKSPLRCKTGLSESEHQDPGSRAEGVQTSGSAVLGTTVLILGR